MPANVTLGALQLKHGYCFNRIYTYRGFNGLVAFGREVPNLFRGQRANFRDDLRRRPPPLSGVAFKSYPVRLFAQHWVSFLMMSSDTSAMDCFLDFVWRDLNVTPERGRWNS